MNDTLIIILLGISCALSAAALIAAVVAASGRKKDDGDKTLKKLDEMKADGCPPFRHPFPRRSEIFRASRPRRR